MRRNTVLKFLTLIAAAMPASAITTFLNNPNDPIYLANDIFYNGVARLSISIPSVGSFGCTGSLLNGATAMITAAHCVTNSAGTLVGGTSVSADFGGAGTATSSSILVFPGYNRATNFGDLALVFLGSPMLGVNTYDLYRDTNEAGQIADIVGFGRFGAGSTGHTSSGDGTRRHGSNLVDYVSTNGGSPASGAAATMLAFDFDNGTTTNNAFATFSAAYSDLGVANNKEVGTAPGDSGGPTFLTNRIAGITSFGACFGAGACAIPPDIDAALNSSFGEMFFNTRVSSFSTWIDAQLGETPEPATAALLGLGLALIVANRKRA